MKDATKLVRHLFSKMVATVFATLALAGMTAGSALAWDDENELKFNLVRSPALNAFPNFVPNAHGRVKIESVGPVEIMDVRNLGRHSRGAASEHRLGFLRSPDTKCWVRPILVRGRYRD